MRTIRFLLRKEFLQIFRDSTMLRMLLLLPVVQLLILSSAATFEIREGKLWAVDLDQTKASRGLLQSIEASGRFVFVGSSVSMGPADAAILDRDASAIVRIPADFQRDLTRQLSAPVQLVFDAEDGAAAGVQLSYLEQILHRYSTELGRRVSIKRMGRATSVPSLEVRHRGWFNPRFQYYDYMVPGILVLLVTVIAMAITAMNIVREKEIGTLEQLNVTPVTRWQFVASKLIPFWIIALFDLALGLAVARVVFHIPFEGSLLLVGVSALSYLFVALGIGLWISTVVETQQQAMFIAFTINMVYLLMSGMFTPFESMPHWAQLVAQLSPVKHFIEIMRTVLVRGGDWNAIATPFAVLTVYGVVVFTLSIRQYSKTTS